MHFLSCSVLLKSVHLISCVFWIFLQNAGSQLCFGFVVVVVVFCCRDRAVSSILCVLHGSVWLCLCYISLWQCVMQRSHCELYLYRSLLVFDCSVCVAEVYLSLPHCQMSCYSGLSVSVSLLCCMLRVSVWLCLIVMSHITEVCLTVVLHVAELCLTISPLFCMLQKPVELCPTVILHVAVLLGTVSLLGCMFYTPSRQLRSSSDNRILCVLEQTSM